MKRRYIVIGSIVLVMLIFLGVLFLPRMGQFRAASALTETRASVVQAAEQGGQTSGEGYVSPVDFKTLQAGNSDIYGWLYIPGTEINEPLLQRDGDNQYYLSHNSLGMEDEVGALFTESEYNAKDFSDIATVIYGKNTQDGRLFSQLQTLYSSGSSLEEYGEVIVYLPDQEIHYQVFTAAPIRSNHILYYYDFENPKRYEMFLEVVDAVRTVDAHRDYSVEAAPGDQLLILQTNRGRSTNICYLVLAKRI